MNKVLEFFYSFNDYSLLMIDVVNINDRRFNLFNNYKMMIKSIEKRFNKLLVF